MIAARRGEMMDDFLLLFALFAAWPLFGVIFFFLWLFGRSDEVWLGVIPMWKQWIVVILGGPIVWLLTLL